MNEIKFNAVHSLTYRYLWPQVMLDQEDTFHALSAIIRIILGQVHTIVFCIIIICSFCPIMTLITVLLNLFDPNDKLTVTKDGFVISIKDGLPLVYSPAEGPSGSHEEL